MNLHCWCLVYLHHRHDLNVLAWLLCLNTVFGWIENRNWIFGLKKVPKFWLTAFGKHFIIRKSLALESSSTKDLTFSLMLVLESTSYRLTKTSAYIFRGFLWANASWMLLDVSAWIGILVSRCLKCQLDVRVQVGLMPVPKSAWCPCPNRLDVRAQIGLMPVPKSAWCPCPNRLDVRAQIGLMSVPKSAWCPCPNRLDVRAQIGLMPIFSEKMLRFLRFNSGSQNGSSNNSW
jgi:hypothetical protein